MPGAYTVIHICLISSRVAGDIVVGGAGGGGDTPLIQRSSSTFVRFAITECFSKGDHLEYEIHGART